eukprot:5639262-Amphidinium_carterae.1
MHIMCDIAIRVQSLDFVGHTICNGKESKPRCCNALCTTFVKEPQEETQNIAWASICHGFGLVSESSSGQSFLTLKVS